MIVPMKKATIIVQTKDADSMVGIIGSLGLLHVEHQQLPKGQEITQLENDLNLINSGLSIISEKEFSGRATDTRLELGDWRSTVRHIIDLRKRLDELDEYARTLTNRIEFWKRWGDFSPQAIEDLRKENVFIKLYQIPYKEIKKLPPQLIVKNVSTTGGIANCVVISKEEVDLPYKEVVLPRMSLSQMKAKLSEDKRIMDSIKKRLGEWAGLKEEFLRIKKDLENELELQRAIKGMGQSGGLTYLTGYLPYDRVGPLEEAAKREGWALLITEPSAEDMVPTLIRNPRWISLINPLFKGLGTLPGYYEVDVSLWFLIFLSLFFGILIGDAGYGLIYLGLTLFIHKKFGAKLKDQSVFLLSYILSSCAIIWGILSGTLFGQEWLHGYFEPLLPLLRDNKSAQTFCFFLGSLHLSLAHLWRAVLKFPSISFLSDLGWMGILCGMFFLARTLVLGEGFPDYGKWFYIIGPVLVILFSNPSKDILKGIAKGLAGLLQSFVNCFTDVVSYIRLFAVGLATVAVADTFNKMAMAVGFNSLFTGMITSLILFSGHLLNVILGPIAVLVHGVRLNMLEFSNHVDVKWGGFAYKPLCKQITN